MTNDNTVHGNTDDIITFETPLEVGFVVEASYQGSGYFAVTALSAHGDMLELAVNTVGPYRGRVLCIAGEPVAMLQVQGQGPWQLRLDDVWESPQWDGRSILSGQTDEVVYLPDALGRFTPVTVTSHTDSNVIVMAYSEEHFDIVVNEIGPYEGTVGLKPAVRVIQIKSAGPWWITPR